MVVRPSSITFGYSARLRNTTRSECDIDFQGPGFSVMFSFLFTERGWKKIQEIEKTRSD